MERFDAIVVGAGPAGSTTAYRLAAAGASVLLVDRARFPRDKPCGGGLTYRAVRLLPFPVDPVVEQEVDVMQMRLRYARSFERRSPGPVILMTQRRRLDHYLAERAAEAGADFRDGVRVEGIELHEDRVAATVAGARVEAAVLIGADGVNGVTARSLALAGDHTYGVALEGNVAYGAGERERYRGRVVIELGTVPGGYGWVFPKGDHFNVGVGGWESEGPRLREHLRRLCGEHGVAEARVTETRGYRLPLRRPGSSLARGRAALVGDAAGLVDPISGDGMFEAFVSGKHAAEAALDVLAGRASTFESYAAGLRRTLASLVAASWGAKLAFERYPRVTYGLARLPFAWSVVEGIMRGDVREPGDARGLARAPLRGIEALARLAGDPGRDYELGAA